MNHNIMKLLMVNQHAPDQMMNAFLAFRGDMVGMLGARNLAQAHASEVTRADEAQAALTDLTKEHKALEEASTACRKARFEFVDNVARVVFELPPGTEVSDTHQTAIVRLAEKLASLPVDEREAMGSKSAQEMIIETSDG